MRCLEETFKRRDGTLSNAVSMLWDMSGNDLTCNKSSKSRAASFFISDGLLVNLRIAWLNGGVFRNLT